MSITSLDVPWATHVPEVAHMPVAAVDVLPAYPSDECRQTAETMAEPWSGQTPSISAGPVIPSLTEIVLGGSGDR